MYSTFKTIRCHRAYSQDSEWYTTCSFTSLYIHYKHVVFLDIKTLKYIFTCTRTHEKVLDCNVPRWNFHRSLVYQHVHVSWFKESKKTLRSSYANIHNQCCTYISENCSLVSFLQIKVNRTKSAHWPVIFYMYICASVKLEGCPQQNMHRADWLHLYRLD